MYRKIIAFVLVFSLILSLSGCFKKTPPEAAEDYTGIELTYYKVFDDTDILEPIINQYEADHKGLQIHYRKFDDFDEYQRVILNEMAEGEGPDVFSMQNTWFKSNYRKLAPMSERLGNPAGFESTFVDVAYKDLVTTDQNGFERVYGLPMTVDSLALYYNKEHFEDRLPGQGKPSTTWEGIKTDVQSLKKEDSSFDRFDVSGIAMGRADNITRSVDILYLLFLQYGLDFYNENISEAVFAGKQGGVYSFPGLEALEFYTSFADEEQKHYSWNEYVVDDDSEGKEIAAFAAGDVSMIVGYSYTYDLIKDYANELKAQGVSVVDMDDVRIAPIPQIEDPKTSSEKRVTYASYFAETVSRNAEYPDLAWDFLIYLTLEKNLQYYFEKTHNPTSRRDMIKDQKRDPIYGVFASQVGFAESFPIIDYYTYKDIFADVITKTNSVGAGKGNLVEAQDKISRLLPEEGYIVPRVEVNKEEDEEE